MPRRISEYPQSSRDLLEVLLDRAVAQSTRVDGGIMRGARSPRVPAPYYIELFWRTVTPQLSNFRTWDSVRIKLPPPRFSIQDSMSVSGEHSNLTSNLRSLLRESASKKPLLKGARPQCHETLSSSRRLLARVGGSNQGLPLFCPTGQFHCQGLQKLSGSGSLRGTL